jgi:hypothetical protein
VHGDAEAIADVVQIDRRFQVQCPTGRSRRREQSIDIQLPDS